MVECGSCLQCTLNLNLKLMIAMEKVKLFEEVNFSKLFAGDSFAYCPINCGLKEEGKLFNILDEVCKFEGLVPLNGEWNKLSFSECSDLLLNALRYDLVFTMCERMPLAEAYRIQKSILEEINSNECVCYTNWFKSPWDSGESSWNSISECTFDIAIVFIDESKVLFTYIVGED